MKRLLALILSILLIISISACGNNDENITVQTKPEITQMRSICELATLECYYHNVAKYFEEDAEVFLWISKDKEFWVEYAGQVTIGIDATLVTAELNDNNVKITIPPAIILDAKVDPDTLTKDSFIVAKNSAAVKAEDETKAFAEAQANMLQTAQNDRSLLLSAQQRAQTLIEEYIQNIGNCLGIEYTIEWVYVDNEGKLLDSSRATLSETESELSESKNTVTESSSE